MNQARSGKIVYLAVIILFVVALVYAWRSPSGRVADPVNTASPGEDQAADDEGQDNPVTSNVEILARNLYVPWEIVVLPDGDFLITERSGILRRIGSKEQEHVIEGVVETGEGGLLGLALHPDFENNRLIFIYFTARNEGRLENRIVRYEYDGQTLSQRRTILAGIPAGGNHNGGRIVFGPDGNLYASTGDAGEAQSAQSRDLLAGKILRLDENGGVPYGNPFDNYVWSYGHRNPQGLAFDDRGRLWAVEHGRSGIRSGFDELNLIEAGKNYGWPVIEGDASQAQMERPIIHSGPDTTWAPADLVFYNGYLIFTGLRGQAVYVSQVDESGALEPKSYWLETQGRLRAIASDNDYLYVGTSNRDGRGQPAGEDDRIWQVVPEEFGLELNR